MSYLANKKTIFSAFDLIDITPEVHSKSIKSHLVHSYMTLMQCNGKELNQM